MTVRGRIALAACVAVVAAPLVGCRNPDGPPAAPVTAAPSTAGSAGEPAAPAPLGAAGERPGRVMRSPRDALAAFASLYVNWSYRSLAAHQLLLAASSVGAARLSERQAAATSRGDSTIVRARIRNSGTVLSVAPERGKPGWWVLVTRERTGGDGEYEGLAAAFHVTLARVAAAPGGYAVSEWLPQN